MPKSRISLTPYDKPLVKLFKDHEQKIQSDLEQKFENPEQLKQDIFEHPDVLAVFDLAGGSNFIKKGITTNLINYFELAATKDSNQDHSDTLQSFLNNAKHISRVRQRNSEQLKRAINEAARTIQTLITLAPRRTGP